MSEFERIAPDKLKEIWTGALVDLEKDFNDCPLSLNQVCARAELQEWLDTTMAEAVFEFLGHRQHLDELRKRPKCKHFGVTSRMAKALGILTEHE